jgi:hypothetical protein
VSSTDTSGGDIFGQIFLASQLEQAVIDLHKLWMETYIAELSLQINWGGNKIPTPRSYTTRNHPDHFLDDQLPQMIVVSPGLGGKPVKDGEGIYRATWTLGIGIIASAKDEPTTKALVRFYAACSRAIMIQHRSIGGIASNLEWTDESYDDIPNEDETARAIAAGICTYLVEVENVVKWRGGPRVPLAPIPSGTSGDIDAGRYPAPDPINQPGSMPLDIDTVSVTLNKEAL